MAAMTKALGALGALAATALGAALAHSSVLRRQMSKASDVVDRQLRRYAGERKGVRYRLSGQHPDPDVDDATLADRVRSSLGPLLLRLDLPHLHVMSENHVIFLHGEVDDVNDVRAIEVAVGRIPGVRGVESYLRVGLLPSDTRPSAGRGAPSEQRRRLVAAARAGGMDAEHAGEAVHAVLATFADVVPPGERAHVLAHLSPDVASLLTPPRRHGRRAGIRTVSELVDAIVGQVGGITADTAEQVAGGVLRELRSMVPEERRDLAAVLPRDLKALWLGASVA